MDQIVVSWVQLNLLSLSYTSEAVLKGIDTYKHSLILSLLVYLLFELEVDI